MQAILGALVALLGVAAGAESWQIMASDASRQDEALRVAMADLVETGAGFDLRFEETPDTAVLTGPAILIGDASRNALVAGLLAEAGQNLSPPADPEGYEIRTILRAGHKCIIVAGGSIIGDVYGLYWIWDRIRVNRALPEINTVRVPAMKVRVGAAWGRNGFGGSSREQMQGALRQSINWVSGPNVLDLVPWDSPAEAAANEEAREKTRALIDYAHALHMKYFSFSNDFTFHPSLLKEAGATLSPCDPKFWDAVQLKYRKLFTALPELDGVELCNDDISGFWDDYKAYDLMHETPECDWSYPKRFRTFVKKVHEVVAGEFGKTYFHFTWALTPHEVHTQPAVFREIFTDEIPTENLYLIPKITTADRWWHQPYNPTFNLTQHTTIVCFETMNYYEGGGSNLFPTFSGQYFQAGLETFLLPEKKNLNGAALLAAIRDDVWDTASAHGYVLYRLMWDPKESMEQIAQDFCAIHFGQDVAQEMAAIYQLSAVAYKYGLHIEPVSYGQFNSFLHMRVGVFPADGYPSIDGGKEHLEFLRRLYLRCKPWMPETLEDIEHGLETSEDMIRRQEAIRPRMAHSATAEEMANQLQMTRNLIRTNLGYVRTMFAYFGYADEDTPANRNALARAFAELEEARSDFMGTPGFDYQLFGVDVLRENAAALLEDRSGALSALAQKPTRAQLDATIAAQQQRYSEVLEQRAEEAVKFAHIEILVDGCDILSITGDRHAIEHLRWDYPQVREFEFFSPLPAEAVTVIPKDLQSRPMHPFVLEQPGQANNYTVRLYLDDLPGGQDWINFDLYYVRQTPDALGLRIPWAD